MELVVSKHATPLPSCGETKLPFNVNEIGAEQIPVHGLAQTPPSQDVPQAWLQPPQCSLSVCVFVSHPLTKLPSQLAKPGLQEIAQALLLQEAEPPLLEQLFVQLPQ